MVLKVVPLRSRSRNEFYDAVLIVPDKVLLDEIDGIWESMLSQGNTTAKRTFGPFNLIIRPRKKNDKPQE